MIRWAIFGAVVLCAGCATTTNTRTMAYDDKFNDEVDVQKVISVNEWAHTHGARIMWINYPQKPRTTLASNQNG